MLGDRFKKIRKQKGLSQKELAQLLSCSSGFISEIENGNKKPGSDILISLKRALNVNIDWLLIGEGEAYINPEAPNMDIYDKGPQSEDDKVGDSNVLNLKHSDVIEQFIDKPFARDMNMDLVKIERLDPTEFRELGIYVRGIVRGLEKAARQYSGSDRRQDQRRIQSNADQAPSGQDRRSGTDRRKAGAKR